MRHGPQHYCPVGDADLFRRCAMRVRRSSSALHRNDLFPSPKRLTFQPGIKHGICHRLTSSHQLMPACIPSEPRDDEVEASCRLRWFWEIGEA